MKNAFKFFLITIVSFLPLTAFGHVQIFEGIIFVEQKDTLNVIEAYIGANPIILEAGAHYGDDTIAFSQRWPNGKILSFEPNPNAYLKLTNAVAGYDNVRAINMALNSYNGTATLNVCYGTTGDNPVFEGASSLLNATEGMKIHYQGPQVDVPCVVLDDWCQDNGIDRIDFMWLDLEGLEIQVLKSSPRILQTTKVIFTETNFYEFRVGTSQYKDLRNFLEESGFTLLCHWYAEGVQGNAIFVRTQ